MSKKAFANLILRFSESSEYESINLGQEADVFEYHRAGRLIWRKTARLQGPRLPICLSPPPSGISDNASHPTPIHAVESHTDRAVFVRFSANARNVRLAAVGTIAILLIVGYISLLRYFHVSELPA